jgi:hypothetical protein
VQGSPPLVSPVVGRTERKVSDPNQTGTAKYRENSLGQLTSDKTKCIHAIYLFQLLLHIIYKVAHIKRHTKKHWYRLNDPWVKVAKPRGQQTGKKLDHFRGGLPKGSLQ